LVAIGELPARDDDARRPDGEKLQQVGDDSHCERSQTPLSDSMPLSYRQPEYD